MMKSKWGTRTQIGIDAQQDVGNKTCMKWCINRTFFDVQWSSCSGQNFRSQALWISSGFGIVCYEWEALIKPFLRDAGYSRMTVRSVLDAARYDKRQESTCGICGSRHIMMIR